MHDLSADKREGMREYGYAYRRGAMHWQWFSFRWRCVCLPGICMASLPRHALYLCFLPEYRQPFWYIKNSARSSGQFVCDVFSALIFPGMLILFIGCELHYSYYERALPYCLAVGLFLLALTTASYFLYDPYRSARRRVGDAKSMIRSIERSAKETGEKRIRSSR